MKRTIAKYKLTILTIAALSSMSISSPSLAVTVSEAESGDAASSVPTGSSPNHTAVPPTKQPAARAVRTAKKPVKMRYGNLLRSKPADPSNFGLLKSYCNHQHGRRWNAK
jgi:hypothetical protein